MQSVVICILVAFGYMNFKGLHVGMQMCMCHIVHE